jgi:hypothetical protein
VSDYVSPGRARYRNDRRAGIADTAIARRKTTEEKELADALGYEAEMYIARRFDPGDRSWIRQVRTDRRDDGHDFRFLRPSDDPGVVLERSLGVKHSPRRGSPLRQATLDLGSRKVGTLVAPSIPPKASRCLAYVLVSGLEEDGSDFQVEGWTYGKTLFASWEPWAPLAACWSVPSVDLRHDLDPFVRNVFGFDVASCGHREPCEEGRCWRPLEEW